MYQHEWFSGAVCQLPTGKAVCIGANYQDHIQEMHSVVNEQAVWFMKPSTAFRALAQGIVIPKAQGVCHHELELVMLIGEPLTHASHQQVQSAIIGIAVGLDLTLREVQKQLKAQGRPWERAKAFDGAAVVSPFIAASEFSDWQTIPFTLRVNNELRQQGNSNMMLRTITAMIAEMSEHFSFLPGDVVYTGTPAGVAALQHGDRVRLSLADYQFDSTVMASN